MGTTISLLALGKKVYLNSKTPQWTLFKKLNIQIYDIENFDTSEITENQKEVILKL